MLAPETSPEQVRLLGNLVRIGEFLPRLFEASSLPGENLKERLSAQTAAVLDAGQRWRATLATLQVMASIHVGIDDRMQQHADRWRTHQATDGGSERAFEHEDVLALGVLLGTLDLGFDNLTAGQDEWVLSVSSNLGAIHQCLAGWLAQFPDPPTLSVQVTLYERFDPMLGYLLTPRQNPTLLTPSEARHLIDQLFIAPIAAAQSAAIDLKAIAFQLEAACDSIKALTVDCTDATYARQLAMASEASSSARSRCLVLLAWQDVSA